MKVGDYIVDCALGRNGIIVDGAWIEPAGSDSEVGQDVSHFSIPWEWTILFDDGELGGADSVDLSVINEGQYQLPKNNNSKEGE